MFKNIARDVISCFDCPIYLMLVIDEIRAIMTKFKNAHDIVWAQEEPKNMGAYSHIMMHYEDTRNWRLAARRPYSAPAAGSATRSKRRHQQVIDYVFDKTKNNQFN